MAKKAGKQSSMFNSGEDSPLFTGSPMKAQDQIFDPAPADRQLSLFGAPSIEELASEKALKAKRDQLLSGKREAPIEDLPIFKSS